MSEVRRWKLKGFIPGIEGESKAVFQPTVVLAEDYDAALAREAALREAAELDAKGIQFEQKRVQNLQLIEAALREELYQAKEARDAEMLNGVRLQQRLTDAEKKLGEAYEWGYTDGQNCPNGYSDKEDRDKCVAELLKPVEGEWS